MNLAVAILEVVPSRVSSLVAVVTAPVIVVATHPKMDDDFGGALVTQGCRQDTILVPAVRAGCNLPAAARRRAHRDLAWKHRCRMSGCPGQSNSTSALPIWLALMFPSLISTLSPAPRGETAWESGSGRPSDWMVL